MPKVSKGRKPLFFQLNEDSSVPRSRGQTETLSSDDDEVQAQGALRPRDRTRILQLSNEQRFEEGDHLTTSLEKVETGITTEYGDEDDYAHFVDDVDAHMEMESTNDVVQDRSSLADMIALKIGEFEKQRRLQANQDQLPQQVVDVYAQVGALLSYFKSGKLPKPILILPNLRNWEQLLILTSPQNWSAQATSAITRVFASNLNPKLAQRFYNLILLPKVREDIQANARLNYHLFLALKRSLFKPAAFFKGILLPLAGNDMTGREAVVFASLLSKNSIPVLHSGVALLKLCGIGHGILDSPLLMIIKTMLNKKYALPRKVIDEAGRFFLSFETVEEHLPVLWHQTLLVYAQRYRASIPNDVKEGLKVVMKKHSHPLISIEIRRELFQQ